MIEILDRIPGNQTAVVLPEENVTVSYESLRQQAQAVADRFASAGIKRGDRIAMALPNGLSAIVCFLGASIAGTAAPLNPSYREDEFKFYLDDTDARPGASTKRSGGSQASSGG